MLIRLRSRDGLERINVPDNSTVKDLKQAIHEKLSIPLDDMHLSQNPALLTTKGNAAIEFQDMNNDASTLSSLSLNHGSLVHLLYSFERNIEGVKLSDYEKRPFGAHMTVERMISLQTRIEHQENPKCTSVSFDMHAANAFQSYVQSALAFSIKRGGILYGTVNEEDFSVQVHAIFEPLQQGSADSLHLERGGRDEVAADVVAGALGWKKVGWIFTQSTKEREFVCSAEEICQMAAIQEEMGDTAVTALVALFPPENEGEIPEVHFEAFQVSQQCVDLYKDGWFVSHTAYSNADNNGGGSGGLQGEGRRLRDNGTTLRNSNSNISTDTTKNTTNSTTDITKNTTSSTTDITKNTTSSTTDITKNKNARAHQDDNMSTTGTLYVKNPKEPTNKTPIIVAGKDVNCVDSDFFLVPVSIKDHDGPLDTSFAIENRLLPQGKTELKAHLQKLAAKPYYARLSDFHVLSFLARQPGFEPDDVRAVVGAVLRKEAISEGYTLIIDSLAGL